MKSTTASVLAACDAEPGGERRFSPTRYPYTYACDFIRQHPEIVPREAISGASQELVATNNEPVSEGLWSRGEATRIRHHWAGLEHREDADLAVVLADAYLIREGITKPDEAES